MKKFIFCTTLIFLYLIYGLYLAQYNVSVFNSEDLVADNPHGFLDYRGITNVHDDGGGLQSVIDSAQTAGLDFLSLTELNDFDRGNSLAGYHGNLLVTMDGEYSYLNSRLLNLGAASTKQLQGVGRSQVVLADLLSQDDREKESGIFVLAHPLNPRYRWSGEYPPGLDGLELINLGDVWQDAWLHKRISFLWSLLIYPFNEKLALLRLFEAPEERIHLWDELNRKRDTIGLAGAGAGGEKGHRLPTTETLFSLVRDHVLLRSEFTGSTAGDSEKLMNAVRHGQFYMCLDILGNPKGFNATIKNKSGEVFAMGADVKFEEGLALDIALPQKPKDPFDVIILKDGERMMTSNAQATEYYINTPGNYRVLVRVIPTLPLPDGKKWIPWIYTNDFHVRSLSKAVGMRTTKSSRGGS